MWKFVSWLKILRTDVAHEANLYVFRVVIRKLCLVRMHKKDETLCQGLSKIFAKPKNKCNERINIIDQFLNELNNNAIEWAIKSLQ